MPMNIYVQVEEYLGFWFSKYSSLPPAMEIYAYVLSNPISIAF